MVLSSGWSVRSLPECPGSRRNRERSGGGHHVFAPEGRGPCGPPRDVGQLVPHRQPGDPLPSPGLIEYVHPLDRFEILARLQVRTPSA